MSTRSFLCDVVGMRAGLNVGDTLDALRIVAQRHRQGTGLTHAIPGLFSEIERAVYGGGVAGAGGGDFSDGGPQRLMTEASGDGLDDGVGGVGTGLDDEQLETIPLPVNIRENGSALRTWQELRTLSTSPLAARLPTLMNDSPHLHELFRHAFARYAGHHHHPITPPTCACRATTSPPHRPTTPSPHRPLGPPRHHTAVPPVWMLSFWPPTHRGYSLISGSPECSRRSHVRQWASGMVVWRGDRVG